MRTERSIHHTFTLLVSAGVLLASCGGSRPENPIPAPPATPAATTTAAVAQGYPAGFITADDITLGPIDTGMVAEANKIFDTKCHVCHSKTDQKVVGPGWKGVTEERKPEWIMNMILHTQWMVENDTAAQNLVALTKTVMPDQELSKEQARAMLELMRTL